MGFDLEGPCGAGLQREVERGVGEVVVRNEDSSGLPWEWSDAGRHNALIGGLTSPPMGQPDLDDASKKSMNVWAGCRREFRRACRLVSFPLRPPRSLSTATPPSAERTNTNKRRRRDHADGANGPADRSRNDTKHADPHTCQHRPVGIAGVGVRRGGLAGVWSVLGVQHADPPGLAPRTSSSTVLLRMP